jgi:hypothetical protein
MKRTHQRYTIKYMRSKLETENEFKLLERVIRRYKFNLLDEDIEDQETLPPPTKKLYLEAPVFTEVTGEEEEAEEDNSCSLSSSSSSQIC